MRRLEILDKMVKSELRHRGSTKYPEVELFFFFHRPRRVNWNTHTHTHTPLHPHHCWSVLLHVRQTVQQRHSACSWWRSVRTPRVPVFSASWTTPFSGWGDVNTGFTFITMTWKFTLKPLNCVKRLLLPPSGLGVSWVIAKPQVHYFFATGISSHSGMCFFFFFFLPLRLVIGTALLSELNHMACDIVHTDTHARTKTNTHCLKRQRVRLSRALRVLILGEHRRPSVTFKLASFTASALPLLSRLVSSKAHKLPQRVTVFKCAKKLRWHCRFDKEKGGEEREWAANMTVCLNGGSSSERRRWRRGEEKWGVWGQVRVQRNGEPTSAIGWRWWR